VPDEIPILHSVISGRSIEKQHADPRVLEILTFEFVKNSIRAAAGGCKAEDCF
jgi:hypothetical protein